MTHPAVAQTIVCATEIRGCQFQKTVAVAIEQFQCIADGVRTKVV
jgi:hypothetical protein